MDGQRLAGRRQASAPDPSAEPEKAPALDRKGGTRADEVRRAIEEDIFLGRLRPGTRLDEESLAQRFSISRTPIREAILQLVHAGLVEKQPRQGAVVAPLKLHQMVQMFEVMSEIEGLCARFAARRMSDEERRTLKRLHDDSKAFMEARDLDAYYAKNRAVHEAIQAGSHNEPLQDIARSLSARLGPYRRYQLNHPSRIGDSFDEHDGVVEAIIAGDPERAYQAMRRHVTIQIDIFTEYVSIMGGSGIHQ